MAKIAVQSGSTTSPRENAGALSAKVLASGEGWIVRDFVCSAGPHDRAQEEQHASTSIAVVVSGTFQYRTSSGGELMTPGSLLLGNAGDGFTCGHEHGTGDHCISFSYTEEFREHLELGNVRFRTPRLPPMRELAPVIARASSLSAGADEPMFEELAIRVLAESLQVERGFDTRTWKAEASSLARVTRVARMIEHNLAARDDQAPHDLDSLAAIARLSPYHFLRIFEGLTGATPHQFVLRSRLRRAAIRLRTERAKVLEIALDCGFGDVSNFNRAFRAEFGKSPRAYRLAG